MQGISLLLIVIGRDQEEDYCAFLARRGVRTAFHALCAGTARQSILNMLGLERTEKALLFALAETGKAKRLMRDMVSELGINVPGSGIALGIPVGSIGGASSLHYLLDGQNFIIGEVKDMEEKQVFPYELIIAIAQRGSVDQIMETARNAGANGGTVIHAKGAGAEFTSQFFGVSIAAEKDVILIVVKRGDKAGIMRAIMERAGTHTPSRAALFSLPVEDVVGLTALLGDGE